MDFGKIGSRCLKIRDVWLGIAEAWFGDKSGNWVFTGRVDPVNLGLVGT